MTVTDTTESVASDRPPPVPTGDRPHLTGPAVADEFARLFDQHAVPMHSREVATSGRNRGQVLSYSSFNTFTAPAPWKTPR